MTHALSVVESGFSCDCNDRLVSWWALGRLFAVSWQWSGETTTCIGWGCNGQSWRGLRVSLSKRHNYEVQVQGKVKESWFIYAEKTFKWRNILCRSGHFLTWPEQRWPELEKSVWELRVRASWVQATFVQAMSKSGLNGTRCSSLVIFSGDFLMTSI